MKLEKNGFISDLQRWHKVYIDYLSTTGKQYNTIKQYNRIIEEFIEYSREYQDDMSMSEINTLYITSFLSYMENKALKANKNKLKGNGLSNSAKITYINSLKAFFSFVSDNNDDLYDYENIFKKIKIKNKSSRDENLRYLDDEEIKKLLSTLMEKIENAKKGSRYNAYRDSLLVKLMLLAGLRVSETLNVKLGDFTEIEGKNAYRIKIVGKGGRVQFAYIKKDEVDKELSYFTNIANLKDDELIMITRNKKPLKRENAFIIVNGLYKKAGIFKKGVHILRHSFAMSLVRKKVDSIVIQKAMRHSNIATTMVYAKAEEGDVLNAI